MIGRGRSALVLALALAISLASVGAADAAAYPPWEGGSFSPIRSSADPEEYTREVFVGEDEKLELLDERTAVVMHAGKYLSLLILAPDAHAADGATVKTTLEVTGENLVTFRIHHRSGDPEKGFSPYVYPVVPGLGWTGGFQTNVVPMLPPEPLPPPSPIVALPPGTVAYVTGVEEQLGTITIAELRRTVSQVAAERDRRHPPKPDAPAYKPFADEALDRLLDYASVEGEAAERGIVVTQAEVEKLFKRLIPQYFASPADYRSFLKRMKLTSEEMKERMRHGILGNRIMVSVLKGIKGSAKAAKALLAFNDQYATKWRARTICAPEYAIRRCSNGPAD